jgi:hypothetical protein
MIRILRCDGYGRAARISKAASPPLWHLAHPSCRLPSGIPPRSTSAEPEKIKSPACGKKILNKRLPVMYFPDSATFPRISFVEYKPT